MRRRLLANMCRPRPKYKLKVAEKAREMAEAWREVEDQARKQQLDWGEQRFDNFRQY